MPPKTAYCDPMPLPEGHPVETFIVVWRKWAPSAQPQRSFARADLYGRAECATVEAAQVEADAHAPSLIYATDRMGNEWLAGASRRDDPATTRARLLAAYGRTEEPTP